MLNENILLEKNIINVCSLFICELLDHIFIFFGL